MQKKSFLLGFGAAVIVAGMTVSGISSASAYKGDSEQGRPNSDPEHREKMTQVFENKDFGAWKQLMEERMPTTIIDSQEKFDKLAEAHEKAMAGDLDGAKEIRDELGLRGGHGDKKGQGQRNGNGSGDCPIQK